MTHQPQHRMTSLSRRRLLQGTLSGVVGLGPYRFVSYQPGVELILEANPDYWRQVPYVKRLVLKSVPEATTRLAMLKKQEVDVAYALFGALGEGAPLNWRPSADAVAGGGAAHPQFKARTGILPNHSVEGRLYR